MRKFLLFVIVVGGLGFGGWKGYEHASQGPLAGTHGHSAMIQGDYEEAVGWLETAVGRDPDDMHLRLDLAECYFQLGRKSDAVQQYEPAPLLNASTTKVAIRQHQKQYQMLRTSGY